MSVRLYGGAHIAEVLGVSPSALANWRRRYEDTPAPTHEVIDGMPLWNDRGLVEWVGWHTAHLRASRAS